MQSLAIAEGPLPNCAQPGLGAENREFYFPPTTHFIATVEDLTDMLDYAFEDIDGMGDDAGEEQAQSPPFTGRWTATSSYGVYMVDMPKEGDDDEKDPVEDEPPEIPPKRRRRRRRGKDSNTGTRDNETPENAEDQVDPIEPTSEQDDREDMQVDPDEQTGNDSEDSNYLPLSEDDVSLGDEDFIVPEEPLDQERFKRRLIATARSLK